MGLHSSPAKCQSTHQVTPESRLCRGVLYAAELLWPLYVFARRKVPFPDESKPRIVTPIILSANSYTELGQAPMPELELRVMRFLVNPGEGAAATTIRVRSLEAAQPLLQINSECGCVFSVDRANETG